jgi:hypothetical protein
MTETDGASRALNLTDKRRSALEVVRQGRATYRRSDGEWLVDGQVSQTWGGRTFRELKRHGLLDYAADGVAFLTDEGHAATSIDTPS